MNKLHLLVLAASLAGTSTGYAQSVKSQSAKDSVSTTTNTGEDKSGRNVMLNAEGNTAPREINIGLPSTAWGMNIMEDDLPVVYRGWPEMPNKSWRAGAGLSGNGLLQMNDVVGTLGDLGYAVNSYSMKGTKKFKFKGRFTTNTFGWLQGDVNVSGPIKNGWTYTAGAFLNFDPGTTKRATNRNSDETTIIRLGLTKFFAGKRGQINFLYKYANSYTLADYAAFRYEKDGKVTELDNFKIGRDSYILNTGKIRMIDIATGEAYWSSTGGNNSKSISHNFAINGNYILDNGWNFKFSTRLHAAKVGLLSIAPSAIINAADNSGFKRADGSVYTGLVGNILAQGFHNVPITEWQTRLSMNKQLGKHNFTYGVLEQLRHSTMANDRVFYYQTVAPQPELIFAKKSDEYGFLNYNSGAAYHKGTENKLGVYISDKWKLSRNLNVDYGVHARWRYLDGEYTLTPRKPGFLLKDAKIEHVKDSYFNVAGYLNARYNINKNFGLLANILYSEDNGGLENYNTRYVPNMKKSKSPMGGLGVFWNNRYIQLVSQVSVLRKSNNLKRFNMIDPANASNVENIQVYYDIQTIGWTTDFILRPFKGAQLHYLITIQNPQYKKFNFEAFGTGYNYSDFNVTGISKVLMEIDPSYSFGTRNEWRVWASFRYYSKQFANLTNVLYFEPHWETFGGVDYTVNKHVKLSGQVVNFLNQRGAKGNISGADLITDPTPYYGTVMTGSYIMPLSGRLTVAVNF